MFLCFNYALHIFNYRSIYRHQINAMRVIISTNLRFVLRVRQIYIAMSINKPVQLHVASFCFFFFFFTISVFICHVRIVPSSRHATIYWWSVRHFIKRQSYECWRSLRPHIYIYIYIRIYFNERFQINAFDGLETTIMIIIIIISACTYSRICDVFSLIRAQIKSKPYPIDTAS